MVLTELGSKREVFHIEGTLSHYTWTNGSPKPGTSFLYGRGATPHEAPSSTFQIGPSQAYELRVEVESGSPDAVPASIVLYGGGWKAS